MIKDIFIRQAFTDGISNEEICNMFSISNKELEESLIRTLKVKPNKINSIRKYYKRKQNESNI